MTSNNFSFPSFPNLKKTLWSTRNDLVVSKCRFFFFLLPGSDLSKTDLTFLANISYAGVIFPVTFIFDFIRYTLKNTSSDVSPASKHLLFWMPFWMCQQTTRPRMIKRRCQILNPVDLADILGLSRVLLSDTTLSCTPNLTKCSRNNLIVIAVVGSLHFNISDQFLKLSTTIKYY